MADLKTLSFAAAAVVLYAVVARKAPKGTKKAEKLTLVKAQNFKDLEEVTKGWEEEGGEGRWEDEQGVEEIVKQWILKEKEGESEIGKERTSRVVSKLRAGISGYHSKKARKEWDEAASHLSASIQSLELNCSSSSDLALIASLKARLARLLIHQSDIPTAKGLLSESLDLCEKLNLSSLQQHNIDQGFILTELADLAILQGNHNSAIDYYFKAYQVFLKDFPNESHFWVPILDIVKIHLEVGNQEKAQQIKDLVRQQHSSRLHDLEKLKSRFNFQVQFILAE